MQKLIKVLDIHRTSFTRIHDATTRALQSTDIDMFEVQSNLKLLEQKIETMVDLDKKLVDLLLDSDSVSDDIDSEVEKADQFVCQFNNLKFRIEHQLSSTNMTINSDQQSQAGQSQRKLKLPKIEMKKFGGDIHDWLPFWSQFKRIHEDSELDNEDKFQYLIQATIPKSRARLIVDSYPPSSENYAKAIEILKSRFGRDDLLVEVYVRQLLQLILTNMNGKCKLGYLYDKIETQLRALDTLGVTSDKCAAMLYPLIESCLPEDILRVWQRCPYFSVDDNLKKRLEKLMNFLKKEVENEERISLAASGFDLHKAKKKGEPISSDLIPTTSALVNTKISKCYFCNRDHPSEDCEEALKMNLSERKKVLTTKGCCHLCLKFGHIARKCRTAAHLKCKNCDGKHSTLMCSKTSEVSPIKRIVPSTENLSNNTRNEVFLQTLMVLLRGKKKSRCVRAIIDTGSQMSYINKHTAMELEIEQLRTEDMTHALFGGFQSEIISHSCFRVVLESLDETYSCSLEVMDQPIICSNVVSVSNGPWMEELKELNINLTDTEDGPIEILIGADVAGKLLSGPRHILMCGLVALKTSLGWTIMGKLKTSPEQCQNRSSMIATSLFCRSLSISDIWNLDILGIADPQEKITSKEHEMKVVRQFSTTVTRDNEGRYQVCMPWIDGHPPLPSNLSLSRTRLDSLMVKLNKDGYYEEYNKVFEEWLSEGIIEELPAADIKDIGHYLPHRHIVNLNSATTKLRPVFDASAYQKNHPALNQCLEKGVNLITLIPSILVRFRMSKIGVISDIRKAFLQISLHEQERNFLRFLWYNKEDKLVLYRHTRVVFGITCSPFLLGAVINHHLQNEVQSDSRFSRNTILKLMKSFYVDNCVTSVDSEDDLEQFVQESREVMADGMFDLRCWETTSMNDGCQEIKLSLVLGMIWERRSDTLTINFDSFREFHPLEITKKVILSVTNKIFDPLGLASPVLLLPKLLLQKTWTAKVGWNEELPEDIRTTLLSWLNELNTLTNLKIPRWLMSGSDNSSRKSSLHVFTDASQLAYAAVIFLRTVSSCEVTVQLVQSKSRVSPLKYVSIPRLELLAASIGVRLWESINESLEEDFTTYFWSDSTTVLSWIKRGERWKPFVWNRIQEIRKLSKQECWFHVPGSENPADLPSRGCSARRLLESRWWEGPAWLYKDESQWPKQEYQIDEELVGEEKRKNEISLLTYSQKDYSWIYRYFSKFQKIVNLIGWIERYIFNCINSANKRIGQLSVLELEDAEIFLIKCVQHETFNGAINKILSLLPFEDENGILRLRTKITERSDSREFRYPAVLPAKHTVVDRLIFDTHIHSCHVGVQGLLSISREKFWILGGRKSLKYVISKCTVCRRFNSKNYESVPVALPRNRVEEAAVFEIVGVDIFGHLFLRNTEKVWVCIFTCAVYRAVHLELVSSLTTKSFLQAFRRFIARRGRPSIVYSDNGGNFVGAKNGLDSLDWAEVEKVHAVQRITWKLNVPTAPWWGGWWERLIRLIKQLLRKVCGRASLKYEELSSILCDCEAIVNSRPLTYVSEDHCDMITLTSAMFLQDIKQIGVPDLDQIESQDLRRRCRYRNRLKDDLRKRFRKEYLGQLVLRKTKNPTVKPKIDDIVLVASDFTKRSDWPLARIENLIIGKDGQTRVAKLKTETGYIIRPVQRLHALEMDHEDENTDQLRKKIHTSEEKTSDVLTTRSGRRIKPPTRLQL